MAATGRLVLVVLCLGCACSARAPADTDATTPPLARSAPIERGPCAAGADACVACGARSTIPGLLVIEARDGRSQSHGLGDASTARFRIGNLTTHPLHVTLSGLEWHLIGDATLREAFTIESITTSPSVPMSASTLTIGPSACVTVNLVADHEPEVGYHVRATYEATFTVSADAGDASVVARSDDMYFRYPLRRGANGAP